MRFLNFVLALAAVLAVAALTYFLLADSALEPEQEGAGLPQSTQREERGSDRGRFRRDGELGKNGESAAPLEIQITPEPEDAAATTGRIEATVLDDRGEEVINPYVTLHPPLAASIPGKRGGFEVLDLPADKYRLTVWSEGLVPRALAAVQVQAGKVTHLTIRLQKGITPRGRIIDETTHAPIAGAIIRLGGIIMRSGPDGSFAAKQAIPITSLKRIEITHKAYDTSLHDSLGGMDPSNLVLPMTRGPSSITGRIINRSGRLTPPRFHLRLYLMLGGLRRQLRREITVKASDRFELLGIHAGLHILAIDFPGRPIATRFFDIDVGYAETKKVTLNLDSAADLNGTLKRRGATLSGRRIDLLTPRGFLAGHATSDSQGHFSILSLEPGTYRMRVDVGGPRKLWFPDLEIADHSVTLEADIITHSLKIAPRNSGK